LVRRFYIERVLRQVFGGYNRDDSEVTVNLVNTWLQDAIAVAAKQCYKESFAIDGVGYVNNSFYTTFKGIAVTKDENFLWKITLPQIPFGIGTNEGVSTLQFKDSDDKVSLPIVWLSESQKGYYQFMRPIPGKVLAYPQGEFIYVISTIILSAYTATVSMVSGGDSTNLNSTLNVPADYFPIMDEFLKQQILAERTVPADTTNDGSDSPK
jgi:hypothetical protein